MNNIIAKKIQSLTDDELKECFNDINDYSKKGMMGDTLVRKLRNEIAEKLGDKSWDSDCRVVVIPEILYEMARRYYNQL